MSCGRAVEINKGKDVAYEQGGVWYKMYKYPEKQEYGKTYFGHDIELTIDELLEVESILITEKNKELTESEKIEMRISKLL